MSKENPFSKNNLQRVKHKGGEEDLKSSKSFRAKNSRVVAVAVAIAISTELKKEKRILEYNKEEKEAFWQLSKYNHTHIYI